MRDFFINIFDKTDRGRLVIGPVGTDSSTGIRPASRAVRTGERQRRFGFTAAVLALSAALAQTAPAGSALSHEEAVAVGRRIWQNECGGTIAGLTSWNAGEDFASLGIGHFIWYPAEKTGPFEESFPKLIAYVRKRGAKLPDLLLPPGVHCPWRSRAEFAAADSAKQKIQLRQFLAGTVDLQADFLVLRLEDALPKMLAAAPASQRAIVEKNFDRVANGAQGYYALIDYVNFKGEGVLATERYGSEGWGLLQVLSGMNGGEATGAFANSAAAVLRARVKNSPPARNEARWLPGWLDRVATYRTRP